MNPEPRLLRGEDEAGPERVQLDWSFLEALYAHTDTTHIGLVLWAPNNRKDRASPHDQLWTHLHARAPPASDGQSFKQTDTASVNWGIRHSLSGCLSSCLRL